MCRDQGGDARRTAAVMRGAKGVGKCKIMSVPLPSL